MPVTPKQFSLGDFLNLQANNLTPSAEYQRAYGGGPGSESGYNPLLDYWQFGGGTNTTTDDPAYKAWAAKQVLGGQSAQDYINALNAKAGVTDPKSTGGFELDPTGQYVTSYVNEDGFNPNYIGYALAGGVAGLAAAGAGLGAGAAGAEGAGAGAGAAAGAEGAGSVSGYGFGTPESLIGADVGGGTAATGGGTMDLGDWWDFGSGSGNADPGVFGGGGSVVDPGSINVTGTGGSYDYSDFLKSIGIDPGSISPFATPDSTIGKLTTKLGEQGAKSLLGRLVNGTLTDDDYGKIFGTLGSTALGLFGASQQQGALEKLASQFASYGAPSRSRYEASFQPGFSMTNEPGYQDALDATSKSILAKLSATGGNPFGNPGGLIDANKQIVAGTALPALYNYRNQNAATGGFGAFNTAAPGAAVGAVNAAGNIPTVLGVGLDQLTAPDPTKPLTLADITRAFGIKGVLP